MPPLASRSCAAVSQVEDDILHLLLPLLTDPSRQPAYPPVEVIRGAVTTERWVHIRVVCQRYGYTASLVPGPDLLWGSLIFHGHPRCYFIVVTRSVLDHEHGAGDDFPDLSDE